MWLHDDMVELRHIPPEVKTDSTVLHVVSVFQQLDMSLRLSSNDFPNRLQSE